MSWFTTKEKAMASAATMAITVKASGGTPGNRANTNAPRNDPAIQMMLMSA